MARLTEDMTRLASEIVAHHVARRRLLRDTKQASSDRKRMSAHNLSRDRAARMAKTNEQRRRLHTFAVHLRDAVADMRTAFASDRAGAHAAWVGSKRSETPSRGERGHDRQRAKA
jgi:hypothetical protein